MGHHHCHSEQCSTDCKCSCHQHDYSHFSDQLLAMADEAWMELLKEKIKEKIEEQTGKHLDQLASLVATANHARWNNKIESSKAKGEYKEKIADYFNS